jgi:hypothetical protein
MEAWILGLPGCPVAVQLAVEQGLAYKLRGLHVHLDVIDPLSPLVVSILTAMCLQSLAWAGNATVLLEQPLCQPRSDELA